ncbi:4-alpha-glucanotransferase [uncultured Cocleimonas sp.]|uniref:4-alpha-glucanotransferase n=1 Tax=uncultured Cocleimonas sp. TaxID=1051587 RepID=UPI002619E6A8|nr:4-alpha-glucanotransferase [uncultured Cocleimonas sp.]
METYSELQHQKARLGGVLLHPTSLPSGVLDKDVNRWLDFMSDAGLSVWQILPLGVPQENLSPYQCYSAFAINPAFLADTAYENINVGDQEFIRWLYAQDYWINEYALFISLKQTLGFKPWYEWPDEFRHREQHVLDKYRAENHDQLSAICWQQFCLYRRWNEVKAYAAERNIMIFGDMPIFVAHDSADVWSNPDLFLIDDDSHPTVVAGVPPDYFSKTGQRWGNPHYNWAQMRQDDFKWWMQRLKNHFSLFDLVRIDHFRGLEAVWVIPSDCETAIDGEWQKVPGEELLQHLKQEMGSLAIVAEDLGIITPEVNALREKYELPGMSVLQFSFDGFTDNPHKPENITYDRIVYTGTHDNDTTLGWFNSQDTETQNHILDVLQLTDPNKITERLIEVAFNSSGQLAIAPIQDILNLGSEARMNVPGISDDNWTWKFDWDQITKSIVNKTREQLEKAGRLYKTDTH